MLSCSLKETSVDLLANHLTELRHLDLSCDTGHQLEAFLNEEIAPLAVEALLLCLPDSFSKLVSLDVSGRENVTTKHIR